MHFDLTISLGNILTIIGCGLMWLRKERRMERLVEKFLIEHEILIADYCKRMGIDASELPTRIKGLTK